jgi:hypothetical protein
MSFNGLLDFKLRSQLATPRSRLAALTLAAFAAAWFWALPPLLTPLLYLHSADWTDADLVRHLWHFRLVPPEWVGSPPQYDYLRWAQAETLARLSTVFFGWFGGAAWILWRVRPGTGTRMNITASGSSPAGSNQ